MDKPQSKPEEQQNMNNASLSFKGFARRVDHVPKQDSNELHSLPAPLGAFDVPLPPDYSYQVASCEPELSDRKPQHEQEVSKKLNDREEDKDKAAEHSLYNQYEEKIRPCIDLLNSLRTLGIGKDLMLPAIAVIGDQSSGKTSILEALSGVALPRGNGIVTRCPLELKLKKITTPQEWKGVIHYRNMEIQLQNASEVEKAIRKAQDIVAGTSGNISEELISLKIWSPHVPDLTLIDLPGIARVAMGNQPQDIGQQIKILLKKFTGCKETINLVVLPCNVDIATTEVLKMAQEVDPTGERTLGILTKPDLVDKGTEETILKIMRNEVIPLRKGYMIVKCRGQQDIYNELSLASAIQQERQFFEIHKHFSILLDENKATIPHLANKLTNELVGHIIKTLPTIENQIHDALQQSMQELQKYTEGTPKTDSEKVIFLAGLIKVFNEDISQTIYGKESLFGNEVRLFTKIRREFQIWEAMLLEISAKVQEVIHNRVCKYEDQYRGREFPGFVSYWTFEDLLKEQIAKLEKPAIVVLNKVICLVEEKFLEFANKHFANFHNLNKAAKARIGCIREKQATTAKKRIQTQFKMERIMYCQDNIYTDDFKAANAASCISKDAKRKQLSFGPVSSQGPSFVQKIVSHTKAYFTGASKRLSNQIPLIILSTVLHDFGDYLQISMLQLLQGKEDLNHLLQEDHEVANHRKLLISQIDHLNKAYQYLVDFKSL
ncbi:interferon-induced GTP-binding protein Mx-like [Numida meleagris]|uniref:interferon-induced GTP-binding protein Mx-like n=1 Tax=Numida meleagris TaxID=8996 RepID=UPI000B3D800C|nr:interferon-induced GTP-binding protein Mx-like [Numida meleagris]XP_021261611.1 interferon-induced GTP-binding protein Mx-like [Numida meleagris]XP_021261620.1 interferon-induced GTP-binding protein Mx-like [Numida meleagris]XP_021261630.1 interferon-induced GTP-binding protein Mx-like [Numida meleagris]XP_021261633.1 interferon-induced GTP-binding protein Mx-like [Numida meleagris]XP_021261640.1 interferon-induced GTP-binding protein Mx-like [Numida meleagris]